MNPSGISSNRWKPVFICLGAILLLPLTVYLSSVLYFALHRVNPAGAAFWSLLDYVLQDPTDRYKQASAFFLSLALTHVIFPAMVFSLASGRRALHGSARFALSNEIKKTGMLDGKGILVGKYRGQLMRFPGQTFVVLAAPTRSGKGVGIVIPNCLAFEDSLVVLDIKQENFKITSGYRARVLGQEVFLFNPFAEEVDHNRQPTPRTHRWNPFTTVSKGVFRVGDLMTIGRAIWPAGGKDAFWNDSSLNLFIAITLYLFELRERRESEGEESNLPDLPVSFGETLRQSSGGGSGEPVKKYFLSILQNNDWLSTECAGAINSFLSSSDDVLANILASFNAPLTIFRNPIVDAATSASDFDLNEVRKKRMTIYIGITPDHLADAGLIVNLLFSQLVNLNTKQLPQDNPDLRHQCLLLMDEFTSIGKIAIIAKAVSYIAGYNLRLFPIIQSVSQLESVYGKEDSRTFLTNHSMQIIYAPREQKDANEYSEMIGFFTEKARSVSRQVRVFGLKHGSYSESESEQKRALMMPQELKELGQDRQIIILENSKPIMCEKIFYYKDNFFKGRLLDPVEIKPMPLEAVPRKKEPKAIPIQDSHIDYENVRLKNPPGVDGVYLMDEMIAKINTDTIESEMEALGITAELFSVVGMPESDIKRVVSERMKQIEALDKPFDGIKQYEDGRQGRDPTHSDIDALDGI